MKIKYLTAGESHGPELTAIVEGIPSNFEVTKEYIDNYINIILRFLKKFSYNTFIYINFTNNISINILIISIRILIFHFHVLYFSNFCKQ